jgi:hypothetical protein
VPRRLHKTWTPEQLGRFLKEARGEPLYATWVLEAAAGMCRSVLCGLPLDRFAPEEARVRMNATRVLAGGKVKAGSGKSQKSRHSMALDAFTVAAVRTHVAMIEEEKRLWGSSYNDHGLMFCWEDGRPIYPDTITEHFNRIVDRQACRESGCTTCGTPTQDRAEVGQAPEDREQSARPREGRVHPRHLHRGHPRHRCGRSGGHRWSFLPTLEEEDE